MAQGGGNTLESAVFPLQRPGDKLIFPLKRGEYEAGLLGKTAAFAQRASCQGVEAASDSPSFHGIDNAFLYERLRPGR